jgi:ABC-type sugar transport system substrate-binding protein
MSDNVHRRRWHQLVVLGLATALAASLAACGSSASSSGSNSTGSAGTKFTLGMAIGGNDQPWEAEQGQVAQALAKQRGWGFVELDNNIDGPTALKNAQILIDKKVNAVIEMNSQSSANPAMAAKFKAAHIPVITFDVAQPGWYFVGVDNYAAGEEGGQHLGAIAKAQWNCNANLVLLAQLTVAGVVNTLRVGGAEAGVKQACPNIPASDYKSYESGGQVSVATPAARNILAADPSAKKVLVVGINDAGVVGAMQAESQLGGKAQVLGWGQDGSLITAPNPPAGLVGSVLYFLEGYPIYAFRLLDQISAGKTPAMLDTPQKAAEPIPPCLVTAAQAKSIPGFSVRTAKLISAIDSDKGATTTTESSLYCPKS